MAISSRYPVIRSNSRNDAKLPEVHMRSWIWIMSIAACGGSSPPQLRLAESAPAAPGAWSPHHHEIKVGELPPPDSNGRTENPPTVIPRPEGAALSAPPGFRVQTFAEAGP